MYSRFLENERLDEMIFQGPFPPGLFYDSMTGQRDFTLDSIICIFTALLYLPKSNNQYNLDFTVERMKLLD